MVAIRISGITKTFGAHLALDDVSLDIAPGEIFFLLGPSGCGKTTLLRTLAGFNEPDRGRIFFDGEDITKLPPHRRGLGMMFQSYALWPHLSVAKNVAFGLEERKVPRAEIESRVAGALASVHMEAYGERRIAQLSGGQQQRVALARALVIRPRALLLDEPLSNLDARLRLEMRAEIRRICQEFGLTALYVTHDQKEALSISDRLAILIAGRVAQVGKPEEVYRRPHSREIADFIGETNFIPGKIIDSTSALLRVETAQGIFHGAPGNPAWQPATGDPVTLSVRPESWTITTEGNGLNCLPGQVVASTYLGEIAQYDFQAADQRLKIFELNPRVSGRTSPATLWAQADPKDVVILPG